MQATDSDSSADVIDEHNFKGIYADAPKEKYIDPVTGAHFKYRDLYQRISVMLERRKLIDQQLGIVYTESQKHNSKVF